MWEGAAFFEGFAAHNTVHHGAHSVMETKVDGLRSDTKVLLRIRAKGESGYGEWREAEFATLPAGSTRAEELPLPRLWLQVDVADLVPLHMNVTGSEAKVFFLELAHALTPHVRKLRRLFTGWSRATSGTKGGRSSELTRQQFMRLVKEVGLCADSGERGKRAVGRSGARYLSMDDVDRIFQRSNYDASDGSRGARRGGMDRGAIAQSAEEALDELSRGGWYVEADPGETQLRESLRPLFDAADTDGSGAVCVAEVTQMTKALKLEASPAQIAKLVDDADADGTASPASLCFCPPIDAPYALGAALYP